MATLLLLLELSFQIEIPFEKEREAREGKRPGRVICVPPPPFLDRTMCV